MSNSKGIVSHLGKKMATVFLVVFFFLTIVTGVGFYKIYDEIIKSETNNILDLKKIIIAKIISRRDDNERISLNYSLEEYPRLKQIILYDSQGKVIYRHLKNQHAKMLDLNVVSNPDVFDIQYSFKKGPVVSGAIKFDKVVFAYFTMSFTREIQDRYLAYFMATLFLGLAIFYILFNWTLAKVKVIFKEKVHSIAEAIDRQDITVLRNDTLLTDLTEIIDSNLKLIINLQESKDQLNTAALVSKTDLEGKLIEVNEKFCSLTGYTKDEVLGQTHSFLNSGVHTNDFWERMWKTIQLGYVWNEEVCNKTKNGDLIWLETTILPIMNIQGKIKGYANISKDITARKTAFAKLQNAAKLASVGELAAGVGHQINNPLTISMSSVAALSKLVEKGNPDQDKLKKYIAKTSEANLRIRNIVEGLRTFSRMDKDELEKVSLNTVVKQTINLVSEVYANEGIELATSIPAEEIFVEGKLGKLQQALLNIISNAKDATHGMTERKIDVSLYKGEEGAEISVVDNGHGIADTDENKIFEPYFSTKGHGQGSGLGLSVANETIENFGGHIGFYTMKNKGSTFYISLPEVEPDREESTLPDLPAAKELKGTMLVVDDEDDVREIIIDYAQQLGLEVEGAKNAEEALEKMQNKKFDYVSTDMRMPGLQGDEFIRQAKELPNGHARYIVITGDASTLKSKDKWDSITNLADAYLRKPFTEDDIFNILKQ